MVTKITMIDIINKKIHEIKLKLEKYNKYSYSKEILEKIQYYEKIKAKLKEWKLRIKKE